MEQRLVHLSALRRFTQGVLTHRVDLDIRMADLLGLLVLVTEKALADDAH